MPQEPAHAPRPSFAEMTAAFARIGVLSFGGPAGQIALMHRVLVEEKRWVREDAFLHALNFCMALPGPEAMQLAAYCGWLLYGVRGGVTAGLLFVAPGFLVIAGLSVFYAFRQDAPAVEGLFFGLKCAVLAIVAQALVRLAPRAAPDGPMAALAVVAFGALFAFNAPFPAVIVAAAAAGFVGARARPGWAAATPPPVAALPPLRGAQAARRALRTLLVWGAIWGAPVALLAALYGQGTFLQIAAFFSKMAVVTFGGAYAVLTYVAQQAVVDLGWLRPGEMLDGLAMAETTPGPLILVLSYVGFLAAFRAPPEGMSALTSGLIGASLTAWVTFTPSFLWIFLGAPYVERMRANPALAGALRAIAAAVVGVIANLSVFLALHVLFGRVDLFVWGPVRLAAPDWTSFDPRAAALAGAAVFGVFVARLGVAPLLVLAGAAGVALVGWGGG